MKKLFVLLILLLSFGRSQAADIEARTGILGGDGWGLQTGAYINFPQSRLFSIQTGLLLHTAGIRFRMGMIGILIFCTRLCFFSYSVER